MLKRVDFAGPPLNPKVSTPLPPPLPPPLPYLLFGLQEFYFLGFHFNYFDFSFKIEKYNNFIPIIWVALLVKDMKMIRYELMMFILYLALIII